MFALLNILDTKPGHIIADEMLSWLSPIYNVHKFYHDGSKFEEPGIRTACELCIEYNEPCLYLHTKGAFFSTPKFSSASLIPTIMGEFGIPLYKWQFIVRCLWKHEFSTVRNRLYHRAHIENASIPLVTAPYVCIRNGTTWYNGFVMNPLAAEKIYKVLPQAKNRWFFEQLPGKSDGVIGLGLRLFDVDQTHNVDSYRAMITDTIHVAQQMGEV